MIRKQLFIDEDLDRKLKHLSRVSGRSEAAHVREALAEYLGEHLQEPSEDPWSELVGLVEHGEHTDVAVNHDHYLYGAPKRQP